MVRLSEQHLGHEPDLLLKHRAAFPVPFNWGGLMLQSTMGRDAGGHLRIGHQAGLPERPCDRLAT
jgi:hypothetical protein